MKRRKGPDPVLSRRMIENPRKAVGGEGGVRAEQVGCQQMRQMLSHTGKHRHSAPGRLPPLLTSGLSLGQAAWSPWAMSLYKPCGKLGWRCAAF